MFTTADGRTITPDGRDISGLITSPKPSYSDFYMSACTDRVRNGYIIRLPQAKPLDRGGNFSRGSRARHDFDDILFESRGEAEDVLSHLVDLTIDYGVASVADFYDLSGIESQFTDNKYGWTNLRDAEVTESMRDAYRVMVNSMYGLPKLRIPSHLRVKDVIFNDPATIVFWEDGTKTVVKAVNEDFDPEKGLAMAFTKKALGNQGNYFNQLKKWIPTKEEENDA